MAKKAYIVNDTLGSVYNALVSDYGDQLTSFSGEWLDGHWVFNSAAEYNVSLGCIYSLLNGFYDTETEDDDPIADQYLDTLQGTGYVTMYWSTEQRFWY